MLVPMRKISATILLLAFVLASCTNEPYALHGTPYQQPKPAPSLPLVATNGESFDLRDYRGKIVLVYFGYTFCPDVCPSTLILMRDLVDDYGEDVQFVMVTVDPSRDTIETMAAYLGRFHPAFIGLWGEEEQLVPIKQTYGVFSEIDPESDPVNYLVSHTARVFLIDQEGILRTGYSFGTPIEDISADIQFFLGGNNE